MTERRPPRRWKRRVYTICFLLAASGIVYWQWPALQTSYFAYRLEAAPAAEQAKWVDELVDLGEPAAPALINCLRKDDAALCAAVLAGLEKMINGWGAKDPRTLALANQFLDAQPGFSPAGRPVGMEFLQDLLAAQDAGLNARARAAVIAALKDESPDMRWQGIAAAMHPELNLLGVVPPLLNDPEPAVRRKAMLAVGPVPADPGEPTVVHAEELLHWLHDPDPEVRRLCGISLRSRGLSEIDIEAGWRLTHPDANERLQLVLELPANEDRDVSVWLNRLSRDPEAAVRASAVRTAVALHRLDLLTRLDEISRSDDEPSVRRIAEFYFAKLSASQGEIFPAGHFSQP